MANYNYGADWNGQDGNVTTVGSAGANNFYGTADMNGNVYEWNNEVIDGSSRGIRGGAWYYNVADLSSSYRGSLSPSHENDNWGFRVAAIPEPTGMVLSLLLISGCVCRRQR